MSLGAVECATLYEYSQRISDQAPLSAVLWHGETFMQSTDESCLESGRLIEELRDEWDEESGDTRDTSGRRWYSVLYADGGTGGRWSYDATDAALHCQLYAAGRAVAVELDDDGAVREAWRRGSDGLLF